ncbi:MAG TPA: beta-L-arabinofuranosidase domain-containing protein [Longimicrobiales bacterium]
MCPTRRTFLQLSATAAAGLAWPDSAHAMPGADDATSKSGGIGRPLVARPIPLKSVRLTGGPLKQAQDADIQYLMELEPDRMLAYYRIRAGLKPKAEGYAGWDGDGRNLTGHVAGHYLSAITLMYAATGDTRFKDRADYIVRELKEVQDKHGDGYLSALAGGREAWAALSKGDIRSGGFDLNGLWSPWYTLHKTYAGLRDAYRHTGNRAALEVERKFAAWAEGVLAPLSDAQIQRMLNTEFGGMNEVLADLYADTGDRRWLELSYKFEHRAFTDPLKRSQDNLAGKHGNTAIPKLIGSASRFVYVDDPADLMAASFFYDRVVQHHSYATAGHGLAEYFGPPDVLGSRVDGRTAESCNVYNMLKLTRQLFALRPDAYYADFQERALFNHALASFDPEERRMCYMVPVGRAVTHEYQGMFQGFTCCMGTGMENHALHGDGIYYEDGATLWVNVFAPSTMDWQAAGVQLEQQTDFPDGETATLKLTVRKPREFTLAVRRPWWAGDDFTIKVNGVEEKLAVAAQAPQGGGRAGRQGPPPPPRNSSYIELKRTWKTGDTVELHLPKSLHLEPTPDNPHVTAIMWGPLVLAGNLGPQVERRRGDGPPAAAPVQAIPVLVSTERDPNAWTRPASRVGDFRVENAARIIAQPTVATNVDLVPFYRLHRRTYSVYFDLFSPSEWETKAAEYAAERERLRKLEAATIGFAQPGEMQPERDFNYQSNPDRGVIRVGGRAGRGGDGWFSFDLPVFANSPMALVVTYHSTQQERMDFDIQVDGKTIAHFQPDSSKEGFFDVQYPIPAELVRGKEKVTVRFQAAAGRVATIFGVRTIKADAAQ